MGPVTSYTVMNGVKRAPKVGFHGYLFIIGAIAPFRTDGGHLVLDNLFFEAAADFSSNLCF